MRTRFIYHNHCLFMVNTVYWITIRGQLL